jgi:O-antigen ligase
MTLRRASDGLLFSCVFTMTFEKLFWDVGARIEIYDVLAVLFVVVYVVRRFAARDAIVPRPAGVVLAFFAAFLLVYLAGFYNLETGEALTQYGKGLGKFVEHFAFLSCALTEIAQRGEQLFWRTLAWFCGGIAANGLYGILQLLAAQAGHNLDSFVVTPLTGHSAGINIYGAVGESKVYRPNGLAGDPNHLGIFLFVPLLVLGPLYVRLERGHRMRRLLAALIGVLLVAELATLSRSGFLGLGLGFLVLLIPYRRLWLRPALPPLVVAGVAAAYEIYRRPHFFHVVLNSRLQHNDPSTRSHFQIYDFVPQVLHQHPLLGLGFNNFSVYYEFVTGKTNWGPHSFYVALIVETGVVGAAVFGGFLWYLFRQLQAARTIGRVLGAMRAPVAARVRPLSWGLTAALVGTVAANAFYLTMALFYFYGLALLILVVPLVFSRRLEPRAALASPR